MKFIFILLMMLSNLYSAPAYGAKRVFKQADGSTFEAMAKGNQHLNWIEDENGDILKYNHKSKNFDYAKIEDNRLKASGQKYTKQNSLIKSVSSKKIIKVNKEDVYELWSVKQKKHREKMGYAKEHKH